MKKPFPILLILACALSASAIFLTAPSKAQTVNFMNVMPFTTPAGRLGFFDQNNGKIYIYDTNAKECVFTGQVKELGQAIDHTRKGSEKNNHQIIIERGPAASTSVDLPIPAASTNK